MSSNIRFWLAWGTALALFFTFIVWTLLQWNLTRYSQLVADRLLLLAELRRGAVQQYFATADAELRFWSTNDELLNAQSALLDVWRGDAVAQRARHNYVEANPNPAGYYLNLDDAGDGGAYSELHARVHARTRLFVTRRGYYDFFLISPAGDVLYSVEKEADYATNLENGKWRESGLAYVFRKASAAKEEAVIALSDMQPYRPSGGAPAMFMATAMHDDMGRFIGVIAFQLPTDSILGIMNYTSGMGDTGETYLVGTDKLMRSDSRFSDESTVLTQVVDTSTVALALAGEEGMALVEDYRAIDVMSVYLPLTVGDTRWAVMAEIDKQEIETGAARERPAMTAPLAFLYGLSLWSVWYWRNRQMPEDGAQLAGLDFSDGGGDGPGLDG